MSKVYEILVNKNEDIKNKINNFMLDKGWENAYISGAIGSARDVEFTAPISMELPQKVGTTVCTGPGEVLTFTGEVMKRELMDPALKSIYKDTTSPLFIHIHASVALSSGQVFGGDYRREALSEDLRYIFNSRIKWEMLNHYLFILIVSAGTNRQGLYKK